MYDLIPSVTNHEKIISKYIKAIKEGEFYEEPLGEKYIYPDW